MENKSIAIFEDKPVRRVWSEKDEKWYFSVVDIVKVLTDQSNFQTARKYWNKLKERLKKEGSESVTNCHQLKLEAKDGKKYLSDVADVEKNGVAYLLKNTKKLKSSRAIIYVTTCLMQNCYLPRWLS